MKDEGISDRSIGISLGVLQFWVSPIDELEWVLSLVFSQLHDSRYIEGAKQASIGITASSTEKELAVLRLLSVSDTASYPPHTLTYDLQKLGSPPAGDNARTLLGRKHRWQPPVGDAVRGRPRPMQCACRGCLRHARMPICRDQRQGQS